MTSICSDTTVRRTPCSIVCYAAANISSSGPDARANARRCSVPDCQKTAKRGGRCIAHGGGNKCAIEGCLTSVVSRGLCVAHGGGKRCQTPACTKSAQSGGFCWVHGGGKKCGYHGCPKRAQSGGACIAHGGGKRCRTNGCNKVVQYDGLCVGHGGYRRCVSENCDKRAMANDYCQQHGGSSVCLQELCNKRAVRGGMCSAHKAKASQQAVSASRLPATSESSDDGRGRSVNEPGVTAVSYQVQRSIMHSDELTNRPSSEIRAPISCITQRFKVSANLPRPPSRNRSYSWTMDADRRGDSPAAPGFSALLNAEDKYSSFTTFTRKFEPAERYDRHHHEHKVYPKLPRLEALQNYCSVVPLDIKSARRPLLGSTTVSKPELRIVVTEDPARLNQTPSTDSDCQEGQPNGYYEDLTHKLYVQSYYYRKNDGRRACSSSPTQRHDWGR